MLKDKKIAFLGAGPMAEAMISGLVQSNKIPSNQIYVQNSSNRQRIEDLKKKYQISGGEANSIDLSSMDLIVLAMQPSHIIDALKNLKTSITKDSYIISVVSSVSTEFMEEHLHEGQKVIRVMPNTSSMIGESATAISLGKYVQADELQDIKEMLETIGQVYILEEKQMDLFTGIAGSGPAYFYSLMEQMEKAAIENGIPATMVRSIVAQTVYGAAKMVLETGEDPAQLRENVCAPNGPTEHGLKELELYGGNQAIVKAMFGTAKRSKEMGEPFQTNKKTSVHR
ncbi:pyrroline-5-carboxylate reductase [Heyndrickxia acidicola]|uniref:Pyrroline-5-carboxylate reductase n=1 Tax=Heyndrickxia acidicola TaxID=209389 RepID=A0ABU6MAQ3_9BACI|nr:pyrroline-5-carboxylate reductase [Heyndrickxia acidicola]MED1201743.1 pyrroline-5-carboxylate reductase [Heyndrickxia acidicola]